jgi:hypothetical protein
MTIEYDGFVQRNIAYDVLCKEASGYRTDPPRVLYFEVALLRFRGHR